MKRTWIKVTAAVLFLGAAASLWTLFSTHTVSLSQGEIQAQVDKQVGKEFPVKGVTSAMVKKTVLEGAKVVIVNNRLGADIDVKGVMRGGKEFSLSVSSTGAPKYQEGAFYFLPEKVEVTRFAYQGGTPTEILAGLSKRYLSDAKAQTFVSDVAVKVEGWMTSAAESAALQVLGKNPVYKLGTDVKGMVVRSSLESVKIEKDRVLITFSLWNLTVTVFIGLICLVAAIGMMIGLVKNPGWGGLAVEAAGSVIEVVATVID
jgi:hypothetical protein